MFFYISFRISGRLSGRPSGHLSNGFTLIELVITLSIVAILAGIAIPGYSKFIAKSEQATMMSNFMLAINKGKQFSQLYRKRIALCPSSDLQQCTGGLEWQNGYIVFVDLDEDRIFDEGERLLKAQKEDASHVKIQTSIGRKKLTYYPWGYSPGSNATVRFCAEDGVIPGKAIIISNKGETRFSDYLPNGDLVSCLAEDV